MSNRTCSVEGCGRLHLARGLCSLHYQRWKRFGDPTYDYVRGSTPTATRFWDKVAKTNSCWLWDGTIDRRSGYGRFQLDGRAIYAHRFSYELLGHVVPDGLFLDHLCRVRNCVNPAHLEPVTPRENVRRGARGILLTHCPNGHPYSGDNLRLHKGRRYCVACNKERSLAWYYAHR